MSSKLKVLQVIPKLGYGGAETGCYDLAHYLSENNCSSYIVTSGGELLKFIDKKKVKLIKLPVHSKNPILIFFNSVALIFIILFHNISIIHARSRAPAWSCLFAAIITRRKFVTTFHGTYNFENSIKKFYNTVMVRSHLIIAGSNFIFSHIRDNYSKYLNFKKKFLVIFRGINVDYFDPSTTLEVEENNLLSSWGVTR
jgi:glycosyltransferase involved in cell wall biosynthesis